MRLIATTRTEKGARLLASLEVVSWLLQSCVIVEVCCWTRGVAFKFGSGHVGKGPELPDPRSKERGDSPNNVSDVIDVVSVVPREDT